MDTNSPAQLDLERVLSAEAENLHAGLPASLELVLQRSECLLKLGRLDNALTVCDEAAALIGEQELLDDGRVASMRAWIYQQMGRPPECEQACDEAEQLVAAAGLPRSWKIARLRGMVAYMTGQGEQGLLLTREALALCEEQGLPVYHGILNVIGRLEEANAAWGEAERLMQEQGQVYPGVASNQAQLLTTMDRLEESLAAFERADQQFAAQGLPPSAQHVAAKAYCLGKLGRMEEAIETFARAEEMLRETGSGWSWHLHFQKALVFNQAGMKDEAIAEICTAIPLFRAQGKQPPAFLLEKLSDLVAPDPDKLIKQQRASQPQAVEQVPDSQKKYDAFISYRRDPGLPHAMLLKNYLEVNGKTVFRDQDDLHRGKFFDDLVEAIRYSRHMVILLTADFFARCCSNEKDVIRREIATALHCGTHIIPVMMEGFSWPDGDELPEEIRSICDINAMSHSSEFYSAFIDKLVSWMGE